MLRVPPLAIASLVACAVARGQEPTVLVPAGLYGVKIPGPAVIERGPTFLTFRWGLTPPTPQPIPTPAPPAPTPAPDVVPTITGHAWAILLHDAATPPPPEMQTVLAAAALAGTKLDISLSVESSTSVVGASWANSEKFRTPLPAVLIVQKDAAGKAAIAYQAPAPDDTPGFVALFNRLRGSVTLHGPAPRTKTMQELLDALRPEAN